MSAIAPAAAVPLRNPVVQAQNGAMVDLMPQNASTNPANATYGLAANAAIAKPTAALNAEAATTPRRSHRKSEYRPTRYITMPAIKYRIALMRPTIAFPFPDIPLI